MKFIFAFVLCLALVFSSPACSPYESGIVFTTEDNACSTQSSGPMDTSNAWVGIPLNTCLENIICLGNCTAMMQCSETATTINEYNYCYREIDPDSCPPVGSWLMIDSFNGSVVTGKIFDDYQCLFLDSTVEQNVDVCYNLTSSYGEPFCDAWASYGWAELYQCGSETNPKTSPAASLVPFEFLKEDDED